MHRRRLHQKTRRLKRLSILAATFNLGAASKSPPVCRRRCTCCSRASYCIATPLPPHTPTHRYCTRFFSSLWLPQTALFVPNLAATPRLPAICRICLACWLRVPIFTLKAVPESCSAAKMRACRALPPPPRHPRHQAELHAFHRAAFYERGPSGERVAGRNVPPGL
jgi:hypothetical protein